MAVYVICSDCDGTGLLTDPDGPCVYCDGKGHVEERQEPDADLYARVRLSERLLSEPGVEMSVLFLLTQKAATHRAEIAALGLERAA